METYCFLIILPVVNIHRCKQMKNIERNHDSISLGIVYALINFRGKVVNQMKTYFIWEFHSNWQFYKVPLFCVAHQQFWKALLSVSYPYLPAPDTWLEIGNMLNVMERPRVFLRMIVFHFVILRAHQQSHTTSKRTLDCISTSFLVLLAAWDTLICTFRWSDY